MYDGKKKTHKGLKCDYAIIDEYEFNFSRHRMCEKCKEYRNKVGEPIDCNRCEYNKKIKNK